MIASSWPALNFCLSGRWLLAMADGVSGRANSLFFLDPHDDADHAARLDWMERAYRRVGLPPRVRLSPLAPVAVVKELQRRGYLFQHPTITLRRAFHATTKIETAPTALTTCKIRSSVTLEDEWLDAFIACTPRYADNRPIIHKMLGAILDETRYFLAYEGDRPVATAMSVTQMRCTTFQNVATLPDYQRRGIARNMMIEALNASADSGASWSWLAVEQTNQAAVGLYRGLGFSDFYSYIYAALDA